jgi:hypothetical protein
MFSQKVGFSHLKESIVCCAGLAAAHVLVAPHTLAHDHPLLRKIPKSTQNLAGMGRRSPPRADPAADLLFALHTATPRLLVVTHATINARARADVRPEAATSPTATPVVTTTYTAKAVAGGRAATLMSPHHPLTNADG